MGVDKVARAAERALPLGLGRGVSGSAESSSLAIVSLTRLRYPLPLLLAFAFPVVPLGLGDLNVAPVPPNGSSLWAFDGLANQLADGAHESCEHSGVVAGVEIEPLELEAIGIGLRGPGSL
jgi:hypothetical protein